MNTATPSSPATSGAPAFPPVIRREDYRAPDWLAEGLVLHFQLDRDRTIVTATCRWRRAPGAAADAPLRLDGENLDTLGIAIDDSPLPRDLWAIDGAQLVLTGLPDSFTLHTQVAIGPAANLELSGLYASGDMLLTQCEAQGFRRITWFQDRPDVMTTYRVILRARRDEFPVLLANGNLLAADAPAAIEARNALAPIASLPGFEPPMQQACADAAPAFTIRSASSGSSAASSPVASVTAASPSRTGQKGQHPDASDWHEAVWEDPFPKPSYLFALVAGKLAVNECTYRLASGREVLLQVWADPEQIHRTDFALASLKKSIAWDENRYGLSLDLDRFMIVAAADFNMGAMENKGLNIFNAKYLFADPEIATDTDFEWIESIIAHEYFHNWTGNRITCRDWFQLTLKEGLTVFRDQEFTADVQADDAGPQAAHSVRALQRMSNVRQLRQIQFSEDAGAMRHPVRPDSYQAIDNFYTATVYEKGAEVVRMQQTLVGIDGFRRGMDLYFQRHDGQAVRCEEFVQAMADANQRDFSQFMRWYSTAGTPHIKVDSRYDATGKKLHLTLTQLLPDADNALHPAGDRALHIPVDTALLSRKDGSEQAARLLELKESTQTFTFEGIASDDARGPILSLLRDFSAPVIIDHHQDDDELAFLLAHDTNLFNRWEAGQKLAERALLAAVQHPESNNHSLRALIDALTRTLQDARLDDGLRQQMLSLPDENQLAEKLDRIDPAALRSGRLAAVRQIITALSPWLQEVTGRKHWQQPWSLAVSATGSRALANTALQMLTLDGIDGASQLARAQFEGANNMTDRIGALHALVHAAGEDADWALARFEQRYRNESNVLDKWFAAQARMHGSASQPTLDRVRQLMKHPAWNKLNPNKVRALLWSFFSANPAEFHRADGAGYQLWMDEVLRIDRHNPQLAARMARTLSRHQKYVEPLAGQMHDVLQQVAAQAQSPDVREVVAKELGQE
ncbi:MAG: aminopeptidase N [Lautropia sp.]|nr:aminopeptidase N [Lautropia sp.]